MSEPKTADEFVELAKQKLEAGDYRAAIDAFTKAIEIEPKDPNFLWKRGIARGRLGDHQGANQDFKKANEINKLSNKTIDLGKDKVKEKIKEKEEIYKRQQEAKKILEEEDWELWSHLTGKTEAELREDLNNTVIEKLDDYFQKVFKDIKPSSTEEEQGKEIDNNDASAYAMRGCTKINNGDTQGAIAKDKLASQKEQLHTLLQQLNGKERDIIYLRFGLNDGQPKTLKEIGQIYELTGERVRQIEAQALKKLRKIQKMSSVIDSKLLEEEDWEL